MASHGSAWLFLAHPGFSWLLMDLPGSSIDVMAPPGPGSLPLSLSWLWLPLFPPGPFGLFADFVMLTFSWPSAQVIVYTTRKLILALLAPPDWFIVACPCSWLLLAPLGSSWLLLATGLRLLVPPGSSWLLQCGNLRKIPMSR